MNRVMPPDGITRFAVEKLPILDAQCRLWVAPPCLIPFLTRVVAHPSKIPPPRPHQFGPRVGGQTLDRVESWCGSLIAIRVPTPRRVARPFLRNPSCPHTRSNSRMSFTSFTRMASRFCPSTLGPMPSLPSRKPVRSCGVALVHPENPLDHRALIE